MKEKADIRGNQKEFSVDVTITHICSNLADKSGYLDWEVWAERTYTSTEIQAASEYNQKRYRVLFDKWFAGQE